MIAFELRTRLLPARRPMQVPPAPVGVPATYAGHLQQRYGLAGEGPLTDFLSRRDGRLLLDDRIDLADLVARHGAPLEVSYCPLIARQIDRMHGWAAGARAAAGYPGRFVYAYATKANYAEEAVRTALQAGAHYESSAAADTRIARYLWQRGTLPADRFIFCNGSKDAAYRDAILALRAAGCATVVPILDDLAELEEYLARSTQPLRLGVRARPDGDGGLAGAGNRFGLTPGEIDRVVARLEGTPHRLVLYHAMAGSQIEDAAGWQRRLARFAAAYAGLRRRVPSLHQFDVGGGMPTTAYRLDFAFDYQGFLTGLMHTLTDACRAWAVSPPDLVGEFGRYTVASHSVLLLEVGAVNVGPPDGPGWYLLDGSLMAALPDMLIVEGQEFVVLPLDGWERPATAVRLAGRQTCDVDDCYPRPGWPPLMLPEHRPGMVVAIFGLGAYQAMLSGRGGVHHCLVPEPRRLIVEEGHAPTSGGPPARLVARQVAPQPLTTTMRLLGYAEPIGRVEPEGAAGGAGAGRRLQDGSGRLGSSAGCSRQAVVARGLPLSARQEGSLL